MSADWLLPAWPAPTNVVACCTTRSGGVSWPPYHSLNLAHHVGDTEAAVTRNRQILQTGLPGVDGISWLDQVHGVRVVKAKAEGVSQEADAQFSRVPGVGCAILTADCLPVLLCDVQGTVVAAAHAGWRSLAGGVLQATVKAMALPIAQLQVWLGPAIGPAVFEVGQDVVDAFLAQAHTPQEQRNTLRCFASVPAASDKYYGDLYALARHLLNRMGIVAIYGGGRCTLTESDRFFSFRRDGVTGRMASVIALRTPS